jgi:hypothetical protein
VNAATSLDKDPQAQAAFLLAAIRGTRMAFARLSTSKRIIRNRIANMLTDCDVPSRLASRIAFQLVLKCQPGHQRSDATWRAIGRQLQAEVTHLRQLGLVDRQIIVALPKLAPAQIGDLLDELHKQDPTIARTILNVALDAAEPIPAAQRYLREFHQVVAQLKTLDPGIARTIANATFMARMPASTAAAHYERFAHLFSTFQDHVAFPRTVAKSACRSRDPVGTAQRVIDEHQVARRALHSSVE